MLLRASAKVRAEMAKTLRLLLVLPMVETAVWVASIVLAETTKRLWRA
jgi:hypothetical protein